MDSLVSVIMPAYNAERFIREAIDSILHQTYKEMELLVVDDGSSDNTYRICRDYEEKYENLILFSHENRKNKGKVASKKLALEYARGDYIGFCDADDCFFPDKIKKQLEMFAVYNDVILVHTGVEVMGGTQRLSENVALHFNFANSVTRYHFHRKMKRNRICNSSVLIRKELLAKLDLGFNKFFHGEDYVLWALLGLYGPFLFLPEILTKWRYHEESITAQRRLNPLLHFYSRLESFLIVLGELQFRRHPYLTLKMWRRALSTMRRIVKEHGR